MSEDETGEEAAAFADALAALKQRGCMLLVAGVGHEALDVACDRLLGEDGPGRRRLHVTTGAGQAHAGDRVVAYRTHQRSAATPDVGGPVTTGPDRVVEGDLGALQSAVEEEIRAMDEAADGLDPAELRVCIDGVEALLAAHDEARVFQFLHSTAGVVKEVRGMGHAHVLAPFDDENVALFQPLFDAVIEVRSGAQQRWHLRDPELRTDWLAL
ncbi:MAG: hypothetical protein ABEJ04_06895 [Halobacteriaceae archaeon]